MVYTFYLTLSFLPVFFFRQLLVKRTSKVLKYVNSSLCIFLLYLVLGSATFNNDWIAYEELYDGLKPTYDLLYYFSYKIFNFFNFSYESFYTINQLGIYLLFIFFVNKFTPKYIFIVVLSLLVLAAPNLSILLRYYTAFSFFLVSVYYLKMTNNKFAGYFFLILSITSHFGAIVLFLFLYAYRYLKINKGFRYVFTIALLLWLSKSIVFIVLNFLGIGSFSLYIEDESSFRGGVFASLPYLPWMLFIYARHSYLLRRNLHIKEDRQYLFLYKLSLFPFIFIVLALFLQIILHRYLEPFIIVWCTFLCYSIRFSKKRVAKCVLVVSIMLTLAISFYGKYFLPLKLLGDSEWLIHYLEILNSNKFNIFKINDF